MNGSHSGQGTIKSESRKNSYKRYRSESRRERNRDRKAAYRLRHMPKEAANG